TDLPFMVYAFGNDIRWPRDKALFDLPNVCGLKYTGPNFFSVQQLARRLDKPVALMSGFDEQFVAALTMGFQGGIGSTYNFAPQYYAGIYENFQDGNIAEAARLQAEVNCVTEYMVQQENWSYRKAIMRYIGLDCGHCRAPYAPLTESEYASWAAGIDELGILQRGAAAPTS
ncbi:MAG: dihydrodipicolinate synthase family protein, partial [Pirellulaceae bacterium]